MGSEDWAMAEIMTERRTPHQIVNDGAFFLGVILRSLLLTTLCAGIACVVAWLVVQLWMAGR
jgi:hypothetical protein